jgi:hypothetical protein
MKRQKTRRKSPPFFLLSFSFFLDQKDLVASSIGEKGENNLLRCRNEGHR